MKTRMVTMIAAGILGLSIAAHAQAVSVDPNVAPSTSAEEARIPRPAANSPQLAVVADPNLGPSTIAAEALIPATSPNAPQLAVAPNPNLGEPSFIEMTEMHSSVAMR